MVSERFPSQYEWARNLAALGGGREQWIVRRCRAHISKVNDSRLESSITVQLGEHELSTYQNTDDGHAE